MFYKHSNSTQFTNIFSMKLKSLTALLLSTFCALSIYAQTYTLPPLKYGYNALEPYIDAQTMEIHHSKHHQAYINNLNNALAKSPENVSLEELMIAISKKSDAVRNNAGGHYNHSLFWEILGPPTNKTIPSAELQKAIEENFKSIDTLKKLMNQAATTRFGSGWAWLIVTPDKKLMVTSNPNQDNPIMDVSKDRGIPVLGIDVWEHAYYLKYQNKRGDYLGAIWNVIDWNVVSKKYTEALSSPLLKKIEKDAWKSLKEFNNVLTRINDAAQAGKIQEAKDGSGELLSKAKQLSSSPVPASFNSEETKKNIAAILKETEDLHKASMKKISDQALKEKLGKLKDKAAVL